MKTPSTKRGIRIAVLSTPSAVAQVPVSAPPSEAEAWEIAKAIMPRFSEYADQYDTKKYWPDVYQRVRREFREPTVVGAGTLRDALLWKYGHLGKSAIPPAHELLISQVQRGWLSAAAALPGTPEDGFVVLDRHFGGKTRFITVAFLLHLVYPADVPIIDQHNFRAVNALLLAVRPRWHSKTRPSLYGDITLVATFMKVVLTAWGRRADASVPTDRELDKFLMMYGKSIKEHRPLQETSVRVR